MKFFTIFFAQLLTYHVVIGANKVVLIISSCANDDVLFTTYYINSYEKKLWIFLLFFIPLLHIKIPKISQYDIFIRISKTI